jgi:DNA-binding NarL/FixJ family response regulator
VGSSACTIVLTADGASGLPAVGEELAARGLRVVAESWSKQRLVAYAVELGRSVLVLDGRLSGSEMRAIASGTEDAPGMAVLVVGPLEPRIDVLLAVASGISGYLPPGSDPDVLAGAVCALCAGEVVLPRDALTLVSDPHRLGRGVAVERVDGQPVELTHREWEVLVLVRQAYSTAEIARHLVVAAVTVRSHVAALVHKLGVHDRTVLAEPSIGPWR